MENAVIGMQPLTIEYLIVYPQYNASVKVVPLKNISNFHGMAYEDPDAFLF